MLDIIFLLCETFSGNEYVTKKAKLLKADVVICRLNHCTEHFYIQFEGSKSAEYINKNSCQYVFKQENNSEK